MGEAQMRAGVREALRSLNTAVEGTIRRELAEPLDLGPSERLQFEICPHLFGVKLVQTGEEILADSATPDALPAELRNAAEAADLDLYEALSEELAAWLAERWRAAGWPARYRPAYALFHGGLDEPRYELEEGRWCGVSEVWPGEA